MTEKNKTTVFLMLTSDSPFATFFKNFSAEVPGTVGPQKPLFLNCSKAVSEGAYLEVTIATDQDEEWKCRIPNHHVLLITDEDDENRHIGFVPFGEHSKK